jgi:4a-hydroxytetrahydrobiopterin dehydratase
LLPPVAARIIADPVARVVQAKRRPLFRSLVRAVSVVGARAAESFHFQRVVQNMVEEKVFSESEITQRLAAELPHWYYESGTIRRKYRTEGWKGTLMVVNAVGHLAEAAWHHPDLTVSYAYVIVKLATHSAKGITDKDFTLARKIEDVVHWQPGTEGGALEGTPNTDQRFRYIKYDAPK